MKSSHVWTSSVSYPILLSFVLAMAPLTSSWSEVFQWHGRAQDLRTLEWMELKNDLAPPFNLSQASPQAGSLANSKVSLTQRPLRVLVFMSPLCPCSQSHEPVLREWTQEFASRGVQFFGIHSNSNESIEVAHAHFKKAALPFPVLSDPQGKWAKELAALKTPHAYLLNAAGEVLYRGGVDDSHQAKESKKPYLKWAIEAALAGKRPDPDRTRVLGCVIQRK